MTRPRRGRWIGGVAAGMARRFELSPRLVRTLWIVSVLIPGPQVVLYAALWIVMPADAPDADAR